jgi:hypothetical protein
MRANGRTRSHAIVFGALVLVALVAAPACARKYQAERDGKDAGEALCDVRDADTAEEADEAISDLNEALDEVSQNYATFTAEDRADIEENLIDLQEHVAQGNELLIQQDITVLRRSMDNIRDDLGDAGKAAIDGFYQGIDDCVDG